MNPYEVARLARNQATTTSKFREQWTVDGAGTALRQTDAGACVFLGSEGCSVHADRPLACRLYPLGRHVASDGREWFSRIHPHPQSTGELSEGGTIAQFLLEQGAAPFLRAADDYYFWYCRVQSLVIEQAVAIDGESTADTASLSQPWVDMDAAIADYCESHSLAAPHELEARKELHLQILERLYEISSKEQIRA